MSDLVERRVGACCGRGATGKMSGGYSLPVFVRARRLVMTTALAGLAAGLVGCGGSGDKPRTLPPLSTTPAATASSLPAGGGGKKAELAAATAIVREYFRLLNNLDHDMNAASFARIEAQTCPCRAFVRDIRSTAAKHNTYFGHVTLKSVTPARDSDASVEVLIAYDSSPGGTRDASGNVLFKGPARRDVEELFYVRAEGSTWLIDRIAIVKKGQPE